MRNSRTGYGFAIWQSFGAFPVVVGSEEGIARKCFPGHEADVRTQSGVAVLGDLACAADADNGIHSGTSFVQSITGIVPNPISRVTEARWLNQPMGILGRGGQTSIKAQWFHCYAAFISKDITVKERSIYT